MAYLAEPLSEEGNVMIGPIVAVNGTGLLAAANIANADIEISKNNNAFAARAGSTPATKSEDGFYHVLLGLDDLETGHVVVKVDVAGYLVATRKFAVLVVEPSVVPIIMSGILINNQE